MRICGSLYLAIHKGVTHIIPFSHMLIKRLNIYVEVMLSESYFLDNMPAFHRIKKQPWKGPQRSLNSNSLCLVHELLPHEWVAQTPIQSGLEHFQGWKIHILSGKPVPVPSVRAGRDLQKACNCRVPAWQLLGN